MNTHRLNALDLNRCDQCCTGDCLQGRECCARPKLPERERNGFEDTLVDLAIGFCSVLCLIAVVA